MTSNVRRIRAMLLRALTQAEVEGDLKSALDISRMLLPLEQTIEEQEAAARKPSTELNGMTQQELLAFGEAKVASLQRMIDTLRHETKIVDDVITPTPPGSEGVGVISETGDLDDGYVIDADDEE